MKLRYYLCFIEIEVMAFCRSCMHTPRLHPQWEKTSGTHFEYCNIFVWLGLTNELVTWMPHNIIYVWMMLYISYVIFTNTHIMHILTMYVHCRWHSMVKVTLSKRDLIQLYVGWWWVLWDCALWHEHVWTCLCVWFHIVLQCWGPS